MAGVEVLSPDNHMGVRDAGKARVHPGAEASEWDGFVASVLGGDVVQTAAWADAKRALGFEVCLVVMRESGAIFGGAQIIIKRFGLFGAVAYVARGPLIDSHSLKRVPHVIEEIERAARGRRVSHLIIQPPEGGSEISAELAARGYIAEAPEVTPTATLRIDLALPLNQILMGMSATKRNRLRRCERAGIDVRIGGRADIDVFHFLHKASARRQRFTPLSQSYLYSQWDALSPGGSVQLFLAHYQSRPLAAIWTTAFGRTVTYRLPGWLGEEPHVQPSIACHWAAVEWAKNSGYRYYDFGGLDRHYAELIAAGKQIPDEFRRSHAAFKTEFGAIPVLLPAASQLTFNPVTRAVVRLVYSTFADSHSMRRFIHGVRNG